MGRHARIGSEYWGGGMTAKHGDVPFDDLEDVTLDELREFLEADNMDVQADPEFRERLRQKLWELVEAQAAERDAGRR